jgi:hypothetical protein
MPSTSPRSRPLVGAMKFIFAIAYPQAIRAFVNDGEDALVSEVKRWEPEARATVARALAEVA